MIGNATTSRDAIIECFRSHGGGPLKTAKVKEWIVSRYGRRWKAISTDLADLTIGGNDSSSYREHEKCLIRVGRGEYRLDEAFLSG